MTRAPSLSWLATENGQMEDIVREVIKYLMSDVQSSSVKKRTNRKDDHLCSNSICPLCHHFLAWGAQQPTWSLLKGPEGLSYYEKKNAPVWWDKDWSLWSEWQV